MIDERTDADLLSAIVRELKADAGTIHFLADDGLLHLSAVTPGMPAPVLEAIRTIPIGKGMAGLAVQRRAPVDACNIQTDTSGDVRPGARATEMAGAIVVPIFQGEDVVGALGVANRGERTFTKDEIDSLIATGKSLAHRRRSPP